jgi:hypothetical protein
MGHFTFWCVADANLSNENIHTVKNDTEISLYSSKDVGRKTILTKLSTRLISLEIERKAKSQDKASQYIPRKCGTIETFGKNTIKSKFYFVKKCVLPFVQNLFFFLPKNRKIKIYQILFTDQIKKNEMGGACGTHDG